MEPATRRRAYKARRLSGIANIGQETFSAVRVRRGGHQELGVRMSGSLGDGLGRAAFDELARIHHKRCPRKVPGRRDVVSYVQER